VHQILTQQQFLLLFHIFGCQNNATCCMGAHQAGGTPTNLHACAFFALEADPPVKIPTNLYRKKAKKEVCNQS
jgi:hypothetical protein